MFLDMRQSQFNEAVGAEVVNLEHFLNLTLGGIKIAVHP